jgi:redox-sensitive bicupin YhaK (pirin superfamily)
MVQLWINLPAKDKMTAPGYQSITTADIPATDLPKNAGRVRVIAGQFRKSKGPAHTFTPINLWDIRLNRDADVTIDLPAGHNAMIAVLAGHVTVNGSIPQERRRSSALNALARPCVFTRMAIQSCWC